MAANMYSEMREEARDHARIRNAYFEQVCSAEKIMDELITAIRGKMNTLSSFPFAN